MKIRDFRTLYNDEHDFAKEGLCSCKRRRTQSRMKEKITESALITDGHHDLFGSCRDEWPISCTFMEKQRVPVCCAMPEWAIKLCISMSREKYRLVNYFHFFSEAMMQNLRH